MSVVMLRRRKLGRTSCSEIARLSQQDIQVIRNDQIFPANVSMVIRWGTTSNVPVQNVLNTASAIHTVGDKAGFRRVLMDHHAAGGPLLCPRTEFNWSNFSLDDINSGLVIRPRVHAQGKLVLVAYTDQAAREAAERCGEGYYASHLINKVAEYRVALVQGRVAWVARKTPGNPNDVAWNVARGGRFDNVRWDEWPLKAVRVAREAFMLSGLHFGGVDVMVDANGEAYVLEINSAPSLTSPYRQECMAKCFDRIIASNNKEIIPIIEERGGYRKFIHPALTPEAQLVQGA